MGGLLVPSLIVGGVVVLVYLLVGNARARSAARQAVRPSGEPLTTMPGRGTARDVHLPVVDPVSEAAGAAPDDLVAEATDLVLQARTGDLFTAKLLEDAQERLDEALVGCPGSYPALILSGEISVKRALLGSRNEALDSLMAAVEHFEGAIRSKPGISDSYVGLGWSHLHRAERLDGDASGEAYRAAIAAFGRGFETSPQNVNVLRGWGYAVAGLHDLGVVGPDAGEDRYRAALQVHRNGDHELHAWFGHLRDEAPRPVAPLPLLREI